MTVISVQQYNREQMILYSKRVNEWSDAGGYNSKQCFPQQAFYGFYTNQGQFRQTGYVAYGEHRAIWRQTKKEAIEAFNK